MDTRNSKPSWVKPLTFDENENTDEIILETICRFKDYAIHSSMQDITLGYGSIKESTTEGIVDILVGVTLVAKFNGKFEINQVNPIIRNLFTLNTEECGDIVLKLIQGFKRSEIVRTIVKEINKQIEN